MSDRVDQGAEDCREWYAERGIATEISDLQEYLRPGLNVLDVGCGPGTVTLDVARIVTPGRVLGIDVAKASIDEAATRAADAGVSTVRYEVGDAVQLRFDSHSFDLTYSNSVLPFIRDPIRSLLEQKRVTKWSFS